MTYAALDDFGRCEWWALDDVVQNANNNVLMGDVWSRDALCAMCEQGTDQWLRIRAGKLTASKIGKVITSTGKASAGKARQEHAERLAAERVAGKNTEQFVSWQMREGIEKEPEARKRYGFEQDQAVAQCGFIVPHEGAQYGYSPDGICADRLIEIKCIQPLSYSRALESAKLPADYMLQIQFGMWITGMEACDFIWYATDGDQRPIYRLYTADSELHSQFAEHVPAFIAEVDAQEARLREIIAQADQGNGRLA